jgi:hypothetical protein
MPRAQLKGAQRFQWCKECRSVRMVVPDRECAHVTPARPRERAGEYGLTTARRIEKRRGHYPDFRRDTSGAVKY